MRNRSLERVVIIAILLLILALCILAVYRHDYRILPEQRETLQLSASDHKYLQEHDTVSIYVEEDLQFLIGGKEGGYLPDYLNEALRPCGLKPEFITEKKKAEDADCCMQIVTKEVRAHMEGKRFTSPLFQVEGRLFLRTIQKQDGPLKACVHADRLSDKKLKNLTYRDHPMQYETADTVSQAVRTANKNGDGGIISDWSATEAALRQEGLQEEYTAAEKELYSCNVCLIVARNNAEIYDILNQCIQECDRHELSYEASEAWLNGRGPVYMRQSVGSSYLPVLIIILSVLIAFFFYYINNRGMYQELGARMDKLTESRNEMQTTFHSVSHYMAELSTGGEIMDLNRAFAEDLETGSLHRRIWDVLSLDEEGREHVRSMVEHGAKGQQEPRYETKIGKRIFVIEIFPLNDARGDVVQLLFMAIDVTQERMAKRQLIQDNKMIAIGQLAAGVAHEIRNPLGIIRNYCYVLKTMEDEAIRAKAIAQIERAVETSGGIINNLLDFSRISPGRQETIDVEEHLRSLLMLNESSFRAKNIRLLIRCPQPVRTYIAIEPFDMIMLNLVKNAMDAIEEGASGRGQETAAGEQRDPIGQVIITIGKDPGGGENFTISVQDTGVGIEEEALEEIFNPFYSTKGNQGTGLGLYIVYSETEKLDGDIDVSSRRGEGTVFRLRLPIRHEEQEEEAQ